MKKKKSFLIVGVLILTSAGFSFVVLDEEANGDCLQHKKQHLSPGTVVMLHKMYVIEVVSQTIQQDCCKP